ncbi:hypothetical protein OWV82_021175 [Melia azedarach]|uniref:Uncharacterized protein n=1 Tax=Melia azedarach TaxID=155640 RepID=A0ACC1WYK7_MELAZ|nr:hypothetical protein OWV82_021175 [Melia azedarach]
MFLWIFRLVSSCYERTPDEDGVNTLSLYDISMVLYFAAVHTRWLVRKVKSMYMYGDTMNVAIIDEEDNAGSGALFLLSCLKVIEITNRGTEGPHLDVVKYLMEISEALEKFSMLLMGFRPDGSLLQETFKLLGIS